MLVSAVCAMRRKFKHIIEALPELEAKYHNWTKPLLPYKQAMLSSGMGRCERRHHETRVDFGIALGGR
jgi:hypothetical protein